MRCGLDRRCSYRDWTRLGERERAGFVFLGGREKCLRVDILAVRLVVVDVGRLEGLEVGLELGEDDGELVGVTEGCEVG